MINDIKKSILFCFLGLLALSGARGDDEEVLSHQAVSGAWMEGMVEGTMKNRQHMHVICDTKKEGISGVAKAVTACESQNGVTIKNIGPGGAIGISLWREMGVHDVEIPFKQLKQGEIWWISGLTEWHRVIVYSAAWQSLGVKKDAWAEALAARQKARFLYRFE